MEPFESHHIGLESRKPAPNRFCVNGDLTEVVAGQVGRTDHNDLNSALLRNRRYSRRLFGCRDERGKEQKEGKHESGLCGEIRDNRKGQGRRVVPINERILLANSPKASLAPSARFSALAERSFSMPP
jgi:hypothetical protein